MKRSAVILAALCVATSAGIRAQSPDDSLPIFPRADRYAHADPNRIDRMYAPALASVNDGVVESAIAQCVNAKIALPAGEFIQIRRVLGSLSVAGRTPALRYKAYLAGLVFDNPAILAGADLPRFRSTEELFATLSEKLQKALIGSNDRKYVREQ